MNTYKASVKPFRVLSQLADIADILLLARRLTGDKRAELYYIL